MMGDVNNVEAKEKKMGYEAKKVPVSPVKSSRPTAYVRKPASARNVGSPSAKHDALASFTSPRDSKRHVPDCGFASPHSSRRPYRTDPKHFELHVRSSVETSGALKTPEAAKVSASGNGTDGPLFSSDVESARLFPSITAAETRLPFLDGCFRPNTDGGSVVVWAGGRRRQQQLQQQSLCSRQPAEREEEEAGAVPQAEKSAVFLPEALHQEAKGFCLPLTASLENFTASGHERSLHPSHVGSVLPNDTTDLNEERSFAQCMPGMDLSASPLRMDARVKEELLLHFLNLISSSPSSSSSEVGASFQSDRDAATETELVTVFVRGEDAGVDADTNTRRRRRREASCKKPDAIQHEESMAMTTQTSGNTDRAQLGRYRQLPGYTEARRMAQRMALEKVRQQFCCSAE
ncbi:hypothetical protein Tc00.1047053506529.610 [Trypanosoma cruzi]|uniref:Uncharacterized protein n=2 Tax=Trypanosoma cruzi TaxID=5693 RepID=Q4E5M0_TRYCC|nr:hypothetical protein Tc00.1047053506529.610 [Trypanosoma cruzi]EAO00109.1 hypothetical protein Tc00.1047053506529.610 [Trypanosoma cruzi]|eukprot:XP_821960.1 hypothetical protein [Trypanosoma cruzi strain CL Brener]